MDAKPNLEQALVLIDKRIDNALDQLRKLKAAPVALTVCDSVYRPILKCIAIEYNQGGDPEPLQRALMAAFAGGMADMAAALYAEEDIENAANFLQRGVNMIAESMRQEMNARFRIEDPVPPAAAPTQQ